MHANETTEGSGAAQLHESSSAAEAACTSRNSLPSQCSKCEKQTATAGCEVYTSCTVTKQAPSSLHCSQARLSALSRKEGGRSRGAIAGGDRGGRSPSDSPAGVSSERRCAYLRALCNDRRSACNLDSGAVNYVGLGSA